MFFVFAGDKPKQEKIPNGGYTILLGHLQLVGGDTRGTVWRCNRPFGRSCAYVVKKYDKVQNHIK